MADLVLSVGCVDVIIDSGYSIDLVRKFNETEVARLRKQFGMESRLCNFATHRITMAQWDRFPEPQIKLEVKE